MKVPTAASERPVQAEIKNLTKQIDELTERREALSQTLKMCMVNARWNRAVGQWELKIDQGAMGTGYVGVADTVEEAFTAALKGFRELDETEES